MSSAAAARALYPDVQRILRRPASRSVELRAGMLYKWTLPPCLEMRSRLIFAVLLGLLFCSLASLEATELIRLADDTSNDFSLSHSEHETSSANVRESQSAQPKTLPATDESEPRKVRRLFEDSSYAAKDSLHFLCIMRT